MTEILVAFGANEPIGDHDPTSTIKASAVDLSQNSGLSIRLLSRMYRTPAWPKGSGADFTNAVGLFETDLPTSEILPILHRVEEKYGRRRDVRWGARSLDLDFLGRGDQISPNRETVEIWMRKQPVDGVVPAPDQLVLPHPRLHERCFVLGPAQDVAPLWVHPILGKTVSEMFANLPKGDRESITILGD